MPVLIYFFVETILHTKPISCTVQWKLCDTKFAVLQSYKNEILLRKEINNTVHIIQLCQNALFLQSAKMHTPNTPGFETTSVRALISKTIETDSLKTILERLNVMNCTFSIQILAINHKHGNMQISFITAIDFCTTKSVYWKFIS